jgi:hypothetical protein
MRWSCFPYIRQTLAGKGIHVDSGTDVDMIVCGLYACQWSEREIGTLLGVQQMTVSYHLRALGVQPRPRGGTVRRTDLILEAFGKHLHLAQWQHELECVVRGLTYRRLFNRVNAGWSAHRIFATPIRSERVHNL